jgi:hypothetical protein
MLKLNSGEGAGMKGARMKGRPGTNHLKMIKAVLKTTFILKNPSGGDGRV